mgnify:CR=1 FL=1
MKKDTLIRGTIILAVAALVARVLGVMQKVPLKHLLGDYGMATYGIAYNIYFVLLIVATAGIPSALSKLISERLETGRPDDAARIYRAAVVFALSGGILIAALLFIFAPVYAEWADDPDASLAIRALAPALTIFPLIAIMRGYFQGLQYMTAGGLSQIFEQILRVLTAVLLAWLLLALGFSHRAAVAGASFGGVMGAVAALAVMLYYSAKFRKAGGLAAAARPAGEAGGRPAAGAGGGLTMTESYKLIFAYSIPITFAAMAVPLINVIDSSTAIPLLKGALGFEEAKVSLGILTGRAQSLAGIPVILAIALSQSAIPVLSSAFARGDLDEVGRKASQAMWLSVVAGLGTVVVMAAAARPVNGLLFGDTEGTDIVFLLILTSMLQIVMMTTSSVMTGLGAMSRSAVHVYVGIAVKLLLLLLLAPRIGMYGLIASTACCFAVIAVLNLRHIRSRVRLRVLGRAWAGLAGTSAIAFAAAYAADALLAAYANRFAPALGYLLHAILVCGFAALLYAALLMVFKVAGEEQLAWIPGRLGRWARRLARLV